MAFDRFSWLDLLTLLEKSRHTKGIVRQDLLFNMKLWKKLEADCERKLAVLFGGTGSRCVIPSSPAWVK